MDDNTKIILKNVSLTFPLFGEHNNNIRSYLLKKFNIKNKHKPIFKSIEALRDINLELKSGDKIGLIGNNGSGNSTLLRVMSGIYHPTKGSVNITGSLIPLLDLSMGINPEATGFENIYLILYNRGLSTNHIDKLVHEIIEFSDLGDNIYRSVRTYSSGMVVRLSVAISVSFKPEILVLDEFFSATDQSFVDKLASKMDELTNRVGILIVASHNFKHIADTCDKIITLDQGSIISIQSKNQFINSL